MSDELQDCAFVEGADDDDPMTDEEAADAFMAALAEMKEHRCEWRDRAVRAETDLATAKEALEVVASMSQFYRPADTARTALARLTPEEP